jgi:hypothetical protein
MSFTTADLQFMRAMGDAVQERGAAWTYPPAWQDSAGSCRYVRADRVDVDEPACIIGAALHRCGMDLAEMVSWEGQDSRFIMREHAATTGAPYSNAVIWAAREAQVTQDSGHPWGDALAVFVAELGRLARVQ